MDAALPSLPVPGYSPAIDRARQAAGTAQASATGTSSTGSRVDAATQIRLRRAATDFEAQFLSQMLSPMFETVGTDPTFGGGQGEEMFRSLLVNEYGKQITARGGLGIGDAVYRELLRAQEASHG